MVNNRLEKCFLQNHKSSIACVDLNSAKDKLAVSDKWLVNLRNCYLTERGPTDYFSETIPIMPNPLSDRSPVNEMLSQLACHDQDKLELLKYILGASLTGETLPYVIVIHGDGNSGKSAFASLLRVVTGEFCRTLPTELFDPSSNDNLRRYYYDAANARLAIVNDVPKDADVRVHDWVSKVIVLSNYPLTSSKPDQIKHVKFDATFVGQDNDVDAVQHRYLANRNIADTIMSPNFKAALLTIAIEYAQKFYQRGCTIPFP
jgi:hypothetical protein